MQNFKTRTDNYRIFQKEELGQEYKQEHDDLDEEFLPPERKPVRKRTGKARYKCAECDFTASTSALLKKHKKTSHKKISNCEECGKELSSDYAMRCHMENYHGNQEYLCDKCDFISGSKESLILHIKTRLILFRKTINNINTELIYYKIKT